MTTANLTVIGNVLFKRGNSTVASAYTGVAGEIIIDTTLQTIRVQDGATVGGHVLASAQDAANIAGFAPNIATLFSNAATQATQILALQSNAALQASLIDSLTSNAATQGGALNDLVANAATQATSLATLTSNAAVQAESLTTLTANAASQAVNLSDLVSNAATQAQQIANVTLANLVNGVWTASLDSGGTLNVPKAIRNNNGLLNLAQAGGGAYLTDNLTDNYNVLHLGDGAADDTSVLQAKSNVSILSNRVGVVREWLFDNTGNLTTANGNIIAGGNITAGYFFGNIQGVTGSMSEITAVSVNTVNINARDNSGVNIGAGGYNNLLVLETEVLVQNVPLTVAGNIFSNVAGGLDITANTGTAHSWNFGSDGNLTLNSTTAYGGINRGIVWDWGLGQVALGLGAGEGSNSYIRQTDNGLEIHPNEPGAMGDGDLRIRTGNVSPSGTSYDWIFNGSGVLTFPGTPRIDTNANNFEVQAAEAVNFEANTVVNIYTDTSGTTYQWQFGDDGSLVLPGSTAFLYSTTDAAYLNSDVNSYNSIDIVTNGDTILRNQRNVKIVSASNGSNHTWNFANTGNLTLPTNGSIKFSDNTTISSSGVTTPATSGGALETFTWQFSDIMVGSETITLEWNLLGANQGDFYLATNYSTTPKYFLFDGTNKALSFLTSPGVDDGGKILFGNATANATGTNNDIELRSTSSNVYISANTSIWKFDNNGRLTVPGTIQHESITSQVFLSQDTFRFESNVGTGSSYIEGQQNDLFLMGNLTTVISAMAGSSTWEFTANGNINLATAGNNPDRGIVYGDGSFQSTAWTGFGNTIAIGYNTGTVSQGSKAVAIGSTAGNVSQGTGAVAIGDRSGVSSQGNLTVAVGSQAGEISQGLQATAVGSGAGNYNQGAGTVAIGTNAGALNQGLRATAVGSMAGGLNQGEYAVAIGNFAGGSNQANNSIIINATGSSLDQTTANTFTVAPIRNVSSSDGALQYNATTKEVTYSSTLSLAGNLTVTGNITSTGKIGYAGGTTVVQTTSRGNGVTINSLSGNIALVSANIASGAFDAIYVNNNKIDPASDIVLTNLTKGTIGTYMLEVQPTSIAGDGFWLTVRNITASSSPTETLHVRFVVVKAPVA